MSATIAIFMIGIDRKILKGEIAAKLLPDEFQSLEFRCLVSAVLFAPIQHYYESCYDAAEMAEVGNAHLQVKDPEDPFVQDELTDARKFPNDNKWDLK